jgi:hypothetical protein
MARLAPEFEKRVRDLIALYPQPRSALLPALHVLQEQDGHLTEDGMEHVAELVGILPAEVLSVASFYDMFHTEPVGRYVIGICTNIACLLDGAEEHAADARAHTDEVAPGLVALEHLVEARRAEHLGRRDVEQLGEVAHPVVAEVAVLLLQHVQHRDERRARLRVAPHQRLAPGHVLGRQTRHYLSTPPITGSTDEMTATASATSPPCMRWGSVCRL